MKRVFLIMFAGCMAFMSYAQTFTMRAKTGEDLQGKMAFLQINTPESVETVDSAVISGPTVEFTANVIDGDGAAYLIVPRNLFASAYIEPGVIDCDLESHLSWGTPLNDRNFAIANAISQQNDWYYPIREKLYSDSTLTKAAREAALKPYKDAFYHKTDSIYAEAMKGDDLISRRHLSDWMYTFVLDRPDQISEAIAMISSAAGPNLQQTDSYAKTMNVLNAINSSSVGSKIGNMTVPGGSADSKDVSIYDYVGKGKYVLVDF